MVDTPVHALRVVAMAAALIALAAPDALAQRTYQILVAPAEIYDISDQEASDLVEESAYLVQDFGGFTVTRHYQLDEVVGTSARRAIEPCGSDVRCYVDALYGTSFEYALLVSIYWRAPDLVVRYQTVDLALGILVAETFAYLPGPVGFDYLVVPCHDALKVTPDWLEPEPQPPVVVAPSQPTPMPVTRRPSRERSLGTMGRAGAYTAGAGAGLFAGGILLGFGADETQQEIQGEPHPRGELNSLQSKGRRQQRMANAFFALGGTALATGVTLVVVDRIQEDGRDDSRWSLRTTGRWVGIHGEF